MTEPIQKDSLRADDGSEVRPRRGPEEKVVTVSPPPRPPHDTAPSEPYSLGSKARPASGVCRRDLDGGGPCLGLRVDGTCHGLMLQDDHVPFRSMK